MYGSVKDENVDEAELGPEKESVKRKWRYRIIRFLRRYKNLRLRLNHTTIHGLAHILQAKSHLARLFWFIVFFTSLAGCMFTVGDRIAYYARFPTVTNNVLLSDKHNITFPAVTICNMNFVRLSYAREKNITTVLSYAFNQFFYNETYCVEQVNKLNVDTQNLSLKKVYNEGKHSLEDFLKYCSFSGSNLSLIDCSQNWVVTPTNLGNCYTFNGKIDSPDLFVTGAGARYGLHLLLDIDQEEYLPTLGDAGVKVVIHSRGIPPMPSTEGISVPAGRSAYIALQTQVVRDTSTKSRCGEKHLNFFRNVSYNYSNPVCILDQLYTEVGDGCRCLDNMNIIGTGADPSLYNCTMKDICCIMTQQIFSDPSATCPTSCSYVNFESSTTYSTFPSINSASLIADFLNYSIFNYTENLVSIVVYFKKLNTQQILTEDSYSITALLSDIGGQLGLFLGASIISVIELCVYCCDELVNNHKQCSQSKLNVECNNPLITVDDEEDPAETLIEHECDT